MRATKHTPEEQYQIIMECRSSGLSDYQWCMDHGIKPGTFYNWVKRLRKSSCYDIPPAVSRRRCTSPEKQDVVKLEVLSDQAAQMLEAGRSPAAPGCGIAVPVIEISCGTSSIRISNEISPQLLSQVIRTVGDLPC